MFIELETGTHTLGFNRDGAPGRNATKTKIERYARFVLTPAASNAGETFYSHTFPDGWPAELLFVVPSTARRDAIAEYVASTWRPMSESVHFVIRALTLDEAPADLCRAAQLSAEAASPRIVTMGGAPTPEEVRAIYDIYNGAIAAIAALRQLAKSNPQLVANLTVPEYPVNHHLVKQFCLRLAGAGR